MDRQEIVNSQDYKAQGIALDWWRHNGYSIKDGAVDIIDAYQEGVIYGWNHPHWIPVEERLPEKEEDNPSVSVNVIVTDGDSVFESYYSFNTHIWAGTDIYGTITHWMPLPVPQRKEE